MDGPETRIEKNNRYFIEIGGVLGEKKGSPDKSLYCDKGTIPRLNRKIGVISLLILESAVENGLSPSNLTYRFLGIGR